MGKYGLLRCACGTPFCSDCDVTIWFCWVKMMELDKTFGDGCYTQAQGSRLLGRLLSVEKITSSGGVCGSLKSLQEANGARRCPAYTATSR